MKVIKLYPKKGSFFSFGGFGFKRDLIFHSDSLISALAWNSENPKEFIEKIIEDNLRISSLFIGIEKNNNEIFFIPRPITSNREIIEDVFGGLYLRDRKIFKKNEFISFGILNKIINENRIKKEEVKFIHGKKFMCLKEELPVEIDNLFTIIKRDRIKIPRSFDNGKTELFNLEGFVPKKDVFFYFILDGKTNLIEKPLQNLINSSGIGGDISIGGGVIERYLINEFNFYKTNKINPPFMSLSLVYPTDEEIEDIKKNNSEYKLINRGGFIFNSGFRRRTIYMLSEGSVFNSPVKGTIEKVYDNPPSVKFGISFLINLNNPKNEL